MLRCLNKTVNEPTLNALCQYYRQSFIRTLEKPINSGMNESEAIKIASQATKNFLWFDRTDAVIKRSKTGQDLVSTFLFAPLP
ncbi:MAG: hypothetical protein LC127_08365 [Chitinophagales bacterium]|nr:hypothetical protein [Chitinophagales bacterium]